MKDLNSSRFLAYQLAKRDISAQYRQSYLGLVWAFLTPIATAAIWILLNNTGTVNVTDTGIPYPAFAFIGTLLWSIIVDSINAPLQNTNSSRSILTKINFPKEGIILSGVFKLWFNTLVKIVIMVAFILIFEIDLGLGLLLFPVAILAGTIIGTTIGLFITPIGMLYKDVGRLITFGLRFLMFATPVVYAVPQQSGLLKTIMELNPLTPIISTGRNLAVGLPLDYLLYFIILLIVSIPLFLIGLIFYRISIPIFVERLSS
ncbi:hypothetical protein BST97_15535 [Nonlabens spongiae]|uniref:Transport permease protein n=1 Tax=Nonlabens spongiae TaxID=331648 RepID=A0A1W6MPK4_9FLAO|nr:hypothetical protein BST97_15535 [Nonlabens spongiae]